MKCSLSYKNKGWVVKNVQYRLNITTVFPSQMSVLINHGNCVAYLKYFLRSIHKSTLFIKPWYGCKLEMIHPNQSCIILHSPEAHSTQLQS